MWPVTRDDEVDARKIRTGLALVGVAFVLALVVALVVDDPTARVVMGLVMFSAFVRAALLVRSLRR
jgi:hypothetical protein